MPTPYDGSDIYLAIDATTSNALPRSVYANMKLLACLTSNGFDGQRSAQTTTNKCSGDNEESQPGTFSGTFNVEGQVVDLSGGEAADMVNAKSLFDLFIAGTVFFAAITDATEDEVIYKEAKVWCSAYSDTSPTKDVVTFTATLTITGPVYDAPVVPAP